MMYKKLTSISALVLSLSVAPAALAIDLGGLIDIVGGVSEASGGSSKTGNAIGAIASVAKAATLTDAQVAMVSSQMAAQIDRDSQIEPASSKYTKRLTKIMAGWRQIDGMKLNFKVYNNPDVNAFAMGDGTVRINSGLMDMMTDDEIRFVLGHEIGHVYLGHTKAHMRSALLSSGLMQGAAAAGGKVGAIANSQYTSLAKDFLSAQYSQAHENAADSYGLKLLKAKKINPKAAVTSLQKLATLGDSGGLMSSHPSSSSRAEAISKQIGM